MTIWAQAYQIIDRCKNHTRQVAKRMQMVDFNDKFSSFDFQTKFTDLARVIVVYLPCLYKARITRPN